MSEQPVEPFFFYSGNFPEILYKEKITVAFSTYQAGKLIFISSLDGKFIAKYAKNFKRPMGIALNEEGSKLALASTNKIDIFGHDIAIARSYPEKPNYYDRLFVPQSRYYTGIVDTHEIAFGNQGLWMVNTKFSTLCLMSEGNHFETKWIPPHITELFPNDQCHLNGLAMKDGEPKYVTMFSQANTIEGWKNLPKHHGLIMDVETNEILTEGLCMPHSPIILGRKIYFLQSGLGSINVLDIDTGKIDEVATLRTFLRGFDIYGDYLFVGASELREKSSSFGQLPISDEKTFCGLYVFNRHTGEQVAGISYTDRIKEIFAVRVLSDVQRPALLTERDEWHDKCIMGDRKQIFWLKKGEVQE
jgi:uncharacterized protein (TIGR03032 family)